MKSQTPKLSVQKKFAAALLALVAVAGLVYFNFSSAAVEASGIAKSVIVQLRDEPAAVWKARQLKAGNTVSDEQMQAYRNSITNKQNQFLAELQSRGINYEIDGVDIKDFNGVTQMRADYRFNLVLNGITLKLPAAAINTIKRAYAARGRQARNKAMAELAKSDPIRYVSIAAAYLPELISFTDAIADVETAQNELEELVP